LPERDELRRKRRELRGVRDEARAAAERTARRAQVKRAKKAKLELVRLKIAQETGALPDFLIIGAAKGGTMYLYHLLTQHPLVEPAVFKEPHFFDLLFKQGVGWYRECFPQPTRKDGRRTITGEATPGYISHPLVPERVAKVVPQVRLIALLRNPVDRAYSHYQMAVRKSKETRTFEEAAEAGLGYDPEYLIKSVYVDHLLRWTEFFDREQLLVLKSEDFFENHTETLKVVLEFLGLPEWEPEASELEGGKRNAGRYGEEMDPSTRRRLEEYFEPHNRRLYDFLGVDFGW
jgi:hypothetical protein